MKNVIYAFIAGFIPLALILALAALLLSAGVSSLISGVFFVALGSFIVLDFLDDLNGMGA